MPYDFNNTIHTLDNVIFYLTSTIQTYYSSKPIDGPTADLIRTAEGISGVEKLLSYYKDIKMSMMIIENLTGDFKPGALSKYADRINFLEDSIQHILMKKTGAPSTRMYSFATNKCYCDKSFLTDEVEKIIDPKCPLHGSDEVSIQEKPKNKKPRGRKKKPSTHIIPE